jgi:hypothetical protein
MLDMFEYPDLSHIARKIAGLPIAVPVVADTDTAITAEE